MQRSLPHREYAARARAQKAGTAVLDVVRTLEKAVRNTTTCEIVDLYMPLVDLSPGMGALFY